MITQTLPPSDSRTGDVRVDTYSGWSNDASFVAPPIPRGWRIYSPFEKGPIVNDVSSNEQAWFWTDEWQDGEAQAAAEIRDGNVFGPFHSTDAMRASFEQWKRGK